MPHVPLFASERFLGKTRRGLYGDVISEIDWSVGEVLDALKRHGLDERTLVIFTSDNGPWLSYGDHAGSTAGLREGKGTAFDGGQRVPMLARWPGRIPAGKVCRQPAMTIDVLPTVAALAGAALPTDRIIDGKDIRPLLEKPETAATPHEVLYFYWLTELHALRAGKWKLHLAHPYRHVTVPGQGGKPGKQETRTIGVSLFDLEADPNETTDVAGANPEVVKRLEALAEKAREDLGDKLTGRTGRGVREPGRI
jgi:arylsulfatase A-like enzyme